VLLDTIERSSSGAVTLANGLQISEENRPMGTFADKVWKDLQAAIRARASVQLTAEHRSHLCCALLAGGGDPSAMPPGLANAVAQFEALPLPVREQCATVQRHLIAVALECSRQKSFRKELENVIQALGGKPEAGTAYRIVAGRGATRGATRINGRGAHVATGMRDGELEMWYEYDDEEEAWADGVVIAEENGDETDDDETDDDAEITRQRCVVL